MEGKNMIFLFYLSFVEFQSVYGVSYSNDKGSLVFVFDTTGSMFNDLKQLREGAEMILKTALEESNVIADFVFVPYHDPAVGPPTVTTHKEVFKSALNIVRVYGGGDCPERSLGGLQLALNVSRPKSFVYVFTDATASDHRIVGKVLDNIQRKQSQVVFVLTGHCNDLDKPSYQVYQQIAAASSGQVFNLNKTSVYKVLEFVRSSIKGRNVNLGSAVNPAGYNYTQQIPVDKTVGEVTVSVSGSKPSIRVVNPSGEEIHGPPQLVTVLDLSEIMIVKVLSPEPGPWRVSVGSSERHSVRVQGRSELSFTHGFSVAPVTSLNETSYRPLKGTYNNMLISLTANASVKLDHAELLDLNGKPLFEIPLKQIDAATYKADAFIPPEEFFNIAVVGVDSSGKEVRRASRTAVRAAPPDVPYLTVPKKIVSNAHGRVVLECSVESLVPVSAVWRRRGVDLHEHTHSLQSTTVQHVIHDMSEGDVGTYRCVASNAAGQATADTGLEMIVSPPQVNILPMNVSVNESERVSLSCSVYSEAYVQRARIEFERDSKHYDIKLEPSIDGFYILNRSIEAASLNDSGVYTCLALNRGGVSHQSTNITVVPKPSALFLGPHTITKLIHSDIQLVCHVENALKVIWSYNDMVVESIDVNGSYNAMLDVDNIKEDGVWTCSAVRGNYSASDKLELMVNIKPRVMISGAKNVSLSLGSAYNLTCSITARPQPRVVWHRETEEFLYHVLTNPKPNVYKSMLTVNGTRGTYFCIGENSEGIDQDSVDVHVYTPMVVVKEIKDTSVQLYSPVKFHCNINANPRPSIEWRHNGTYINNTNILIDNDVMIIERVDFDDLGVYSCVADNGFEKMVMNFTLGVHGLARPLILKEPIKILVQKGKALSLTCRILSGNPKPNVTFQYRKFSNFTDLPEAVIKNDTVSIDKIDKEKSGTYRCKASNVIGEDVYDVTVAVQYPPEFNFKQEAYKTEGPVQVKMGEKISLKCNVTGDPLPVVTWTKNSAPILYTSNLYFNGDTLVIQNASKLDSGDFACNASNVLGSILKNFTILVYAPPIVSSTSNASLEVLEGQLVELPCVATGLPAPRVRWAHNGQDINDTRRYRDEYGLRFIANLTDFGEYICIANNAFGNSSLNYTLYIWVTPSIENLAEAVTNTNKGSNVSFECNAVGFPIPMILWEFNGVVLSENTSQVRFNEMGYLSITNVSESTEGVYTCIAENIAGTALKEFVVNVNEPPRILSDNFTGPYIASTLDKVLALSCRAAGDPQPFVFWAKDGIDLHRDSRYHIDSEGTLNIKNPTEDLSGMYTCFARSFVGNASKDVDVKIYSPPLLMQDEGRPFITRAVEGTRVEVDCPVRGNVTVKWYKDAILISNETLKFSNISRTNASTYSCVATNIMGSIYTDVIIDVQWPPKLQDGGDVEVLAGNDFYIDCQTEAKPPAQVKWLFNSKMLIGESKEKLSILDAKVSNSGIYRCVVSNTHGTVFKDTRLQVIEPPFISVFDYLEVELKAGSDATLDCNATGSPQPNVTWAYNNTNWVLQGTSLVSFNTTTLSEGSFTCKASNRAGSKSIIYRVVVIVTPAIREIVIFIGGEGRNVEENVEIVIGTNARIACKASGNPGPVIQWIHNGNIVSNETGLYADLIFKNATVTDRGLYVCIASNIGGVDRRQVKVDVLEPPRIFKNLFHNDNSSQSSVKLQVISNQVFYLHCHPYGTPLPDVYWFKDGVPLKFYDDQMLSTDYGEIVVSRSAKYEQSGNYTCVARNKVDSASVSYLVDVLVPPPPQKGDIRQVSTLAGLPLNITCPVEGRPVPFVMWIKHPYIEVVDNTRIQLLDYNNTLFFTKTEKTDSGRYSCVITNSVGTTEVLYDVAVLLPPTIAGNDSQVVVALGRSVVLKCEVDGVPEPNITWYKDFQPVSPSSAAVQAASHTSVCCVWRVVEAHSGRYSCVADNGVGTAHRRYTVVVKVPGKWSSWSSWGYCNVTCGPGYQHRDRQCQYIDNNNNTINRNNKPEFIIIDEASCKGSSVDRRKCNMPLCESPLSSWSRWSLWSPCSATCGAAVQLRTRDCLRDSCGGDHVQVRKCPGVPKCKTSKVQAAIVEDADENDLNPDFIPEATFEVQPETNIIAKPTIIRPIKAVNVPEPPPVYEVKVTENLDGSERGPCEPGDKFIVDTNKCEDIDECVLSGNSCHLTQTCVNMRRGYACSCGKGYTSLGAGQRCIDVNECTQGVHDCEYACVNTAGGYVCACPAPLRLHRDRTHCVMPSMQHEPVQYDDNGDTIVVKPLDYYKYLQI